jgi:hypothetical protein
LIVLPEAEDEVVEAGMFATFTLSLVQLLLDLRPANNTPSAAWNDLLQSPKKYTSCHGL